MEVWGPTEWREIYSKQREDCRHNNYLTIIISIVSLGREPMEQSVLHKQL